MNRKRYKLMIVAGEASGDAHAARLARALRESDPEAEFELFGSAGPAMREQGVESIADADDFAIVGVPEVLKAVPMFLGVRRKLLAEAAARRPDAVILVDFPEFNLKLARALKKMGLAVIYYISPQLWAWRKYRSRTIRKYVDLLISILPFEKDWYARHGISHVEFVGNPLAAEVARDITRREFCEKYGLDESRPLIALLPGSRKTEITRHLPIMISAAARLCGQHPSAQFVVALSDSRSSIEAERSLSGIEPGLALPVYGDTYNALAASDAAAVCSGTATMEAAILGTPLVVVYRGSALNYRLLMPLIDVEHFGLLNLVAGERVASELIQGDLTPENLASELDRLLDPDTNREFRDRLAMVAGMLGEGEASKRAAGAVLRILTRV